MNPLELWGGAECTVNRVGSHFGDQLQATGHHDREQDIELFGELGLKAVRFPLLWERISPRMDANPDWEWSDTRLARLKGLGIRPIAGLVHHGSGPSHTSLIDDGFATGLAAHARAVAERYPWIEDWTPVNEPLTTARFSALYGHWHPHTRDEALFWLALLNQVDAVRLAMRAIREVNPAGRLIQTDDLGRTYATASLGDQAAFDNVRRWMTWDLLFGLVIPGHDLWDRLCGFGLEARLSRIAADPCPPDVIGINHYLTSDRFLDHRVGLYPKVLHGGSGSRTFADIEAVRVLHPISAGLDGAIRESWNRYGKPIAITEVHNGCTRDEQIRWFQEAWATAMQARRDGVEVQAVTAWALFGSSGWNTLLTGPGVYEPGAYDVSSGHPRPTAMAQLLQHLAAGTAPPSAVPGSGWWRRDIRLHHPATPRAAPARHYASPREAAEPDAPILIVGATGTLGQALAAACRHRGLRYVLTSRSELDLLAPDTIADALDLHQPWAVLNAGGWVKVDEAELEPALCLSANHRGGVSLARACSERGIRTVSFSSDLVFDGAKASPYRESDRPAPLNIYGHSKRRLEQALQKLGGTHLVVRTAAFFSPFDQHNFAVAAARAGSAGKRFRASSDSIITPTFVPDLCDAVLDLVIDGETGVWHLSNGHPLTWSDFAVRVLDVCGLDTSLVEAVPGQHLGWAARRPRQCALQSERGNLMGELDRALMRFAQHAAVLA